MRDEEDKKLSSGLERALKKIQEMDNPVDIIFIHEDLDIREFIFKSIELTNDTNQ